MTTGTPTSRSRPSKRHCPEKDVGVRSALRLVTRARPSVAIPVLDGQHAGQAPFTPRVDEAS
jgi:hypothetical protein